MDVLSEPELRRWRIWGTVVVIALVGAGAWWLFRVPTVGKGGGLLAVGATLMPLFWDKMASFGRMSWVFMLFVLLAVEYRAINKEHYENAEAQKQTLEQIGNGFHDVLTAEQTNFSHMIETTQTNFAKLINEERTNFETTMANSLSAQRQEQKDLDRPQILLKREVRDLIKEMQTTLALSLLHNADKEAVCTMIYKDPGYLERLRGIVARLKLNPYVRQDLVVRLEDYGGLTHGTNGAGCWLLEHTLDILHGIGESIPDHVSSIPKAK